MPEYERKLTLPGKIEQVRVACDFVVKAAQAAGLGDDGIFQSQLAVEEIFTNIVEHGYEHNNGNKTIELITEITPDRLIISILDEAPHFNPLQLDTPDATASLWERERGGWGVYFVRQYMDKVDYKLDNDRNRIILEKKRPQAS